MLVMGFYGFSQADISVRKGVTFEKDFLSDDIHSNSYLVVGAGIDFLEGKRMLGVSGDTFFFEGRPIRGNFKAKFGWDVFNVGVGVNTGVKSEDEVPTLVNLEETELTLGAELNLFSKKNTNITIGYDYFTGAKPYRYTNAITAGLKFKFN